MSFFSTNTGFGGYYPSTGILTDARDGQKYKTTTIGDQVWMAENLNYAYLQPTADLDSSSFCYDNDPAMCKKYGRLYLWSAAMDSAGVLKNDGKGKGCGNGVDCGVEGSVQGVCPKGWHLPSGDEFETLVESVGESFVNLSVPSWEDGVDKYGFSALPAGEYMGFNGVFFHALDFSALFWSSTECHEGYTEYAYEMYANTLYVDDEHVPNVGGNFKRTGNSVRCLKDN